MNKWNARYAFSGDAVPAPSEVLSRHAGLLPRSPEPGSGEALRALDLACGRAGNAEWLGARGFETTAWDASEAVIDAVRARPASAVRHTEVRDVVARPPPEASFDVVVVARFLERGLCPTIARALRPGGLLFYQTFTHGLRNPDYLLGPNELLELFPSLAVLRYREPAPGADGRAEAMLVGRRAPA